MSKKPPTAEDLFAELDNLSEKTSAPPSKATKASKVTKTAPKKTEDNALAGLEELSNLAKAKPASRPNTPKLKKDAPAPSTTSARTSEDRTATNVPRKSADSARGYHQSTTPAAVAEETKKESAPSQDKAEDKSGGGGWWGGWGNVVATATATATAAVSAAQKQAEAAVKEIQKNEEAQRWAGQVVQNARGLRGISDDLRARAIPTFSSLLAHIAPPISAHERLAIHTTHDFSSYPSLDPLIYSVFSRVMLQVEGGDLLVIQRGSESTQRRGSDVGFKGGSTAGWNDGPWWRSPGKRDIGAVPGLREGTKLTRVSAESYAREFFDARGGLEEAAKQASMVLSESNPVRSSDIFLAIQAINFPAEEDYFSGSTANESKQSEGGMIDADEPEEMIAFAIYIYDPIHSISFSTLSQSIPFKWVEWLDAAPAEDTEGGHALPSEIREIIESGGVDPREWVAEWIEETLSLSVGVVAQRYVARRMGVGEGGVGKGKMPARQESVEGGAGEAARAGVI